MTARRTPIVQQAVASLLVAALGGYPVRALAQGVPVQSLPPPPTYAPAQPAPPQPQQPQMQQREAQREVQRGRPPEARARIPEQQRGQGREQMR